MGSYHQGGTFASLVNIIVARPEGMSRKKWHELKCGGEMARKNKKTEGVTSDGVLDLRHTGVTRLNIPPAGIEARGEIAGERKLKYAYNPHL